MDNMKRMMIKTLKKLINSYKECMQIYGDALLRGGSYGCA
ncbi:hypothetical protein HMPREF1870_00636 [Bacteroidales bacterium KA00344]|nr:hypothetical protein HMPREF1870_00636 [Bacteroidales bacterium KA00344]